MLSQMNAASADSIMANNIVKKYHSQSYDFTHDCIIQAPAQEEPSAVEVLKATINKKYRSVSYDVHDQTYATQLLEFFGRERIDVQEKFNEFTQNLMAEREINRYALLGAIDEYKANEEAYAAFPLSMAFENMAFNCRPYQPCVIC